MRRRLLGRRCAAVVAAVAMFAVVLSHAAITYLGVFPVHEGETVLEPLKVGAFKTSCPGGVLSYGVGDAQGNSASFPNVHDPTISFTATVTGMTAGTRMTYVDVTVLCNATTPVGGTPRVYFRVSPSVTTTAPPTSSTTTTPAPTLQCKSGDAASVANGASATFPATAYTAGCASPTLQVTTATGPAPSASSLFSVQSIAGSSTLVFNANGVSLPAGNYTATVLVSCGSGTCVVTQAVTVAAPTTTTAPPTPSCPGDYQYSLMLNADGSFTEQASSFSTRATASGSFCASGAITATVQSPSHGKVRLGSAGTFYYTPDTPAAGDAVDSFPFELTCAADGAKCGGTAVISIVSADNGTIYYAVEGAIACRGTCDARAWRASPTAGDVFDVNESGVAVTRRQDGRDVDGVDFDFTRSGELLIHAYTTIGNLAARFVTFYPITKADAQGLFDKASVPYGSHVSFEPSCLDKQANTGSGADIWSWTDATALTGHLNTQTGAYKSGDNYYQKFGGNHRQCDVYRADPCKYAPLMTPTLNDDNNNAMNSATPSVQWRLFINNCDATWVGKASVESLRALRQPDGSPTFTLEGNGAYLVGTVYSQSVKPASWTSPAAGIKHSETAYKLRLKIHNMIAVDAVAVSNGGDAVAPEAKLNMSSDVQYSTGRRASTAERLYRYSVLLYPYFAANRTAANVTATSLKVVSTTLLNSTWTSPSKVECPKCTGTKISCKGTGNGFETDCGDEALMTFEAIDYNASDFTGAGSTGSSAGKPPSTTVSDKNALRVTFAARANGAGSDESTDAFPVGTFAISVKVSNGQVFEVVVNQTDYISELNTRFLDTELCRSSAYWPVPDPLGTSVPVKPYSAESLAFPNGVSTGKKVEEKEGAAHETYYGAPERLVADGVCAAPPSAERSHIILTEMSTTVTNGGETVQLSMCAVNNEQTYGTTDWVMLSFPQIHEEIKSINSEEIQGITENSALGSNSYTVAQLQYLTVSVHASEVVQSLSTKAASNGYVNILLEGDNAPAAQRSEEDTWMHPNSSSPSDAADAYLPWGSYASSLSYRRIEHRTTNNSETEPFHFSFIPGSLLHSDSNIRVPLLVRASIKFITYAFTAANATHSPQRVKQGERDESLLYIVSVSRGISAALRFDSDAYHPTITQSGISSKPATAIIIILIIGVVCVLAASVYVEVTYRRIIHNAKYYPKRPDSAIGVRYGRDGKPKENQKTAKEGSRTESGVPSSASKTRTASGTAPGDASASSLKTRFGVVRGEQKRVPESSAGSSSAASDAGGGAAAADGDYAVENPPVGDEQPRVVDDEVAEL
ncbi:hypothetical protein NESM_000008200 [Novymonas esmeraldas]|uniref:Uncharacterized protein n=1 Tax=Novymonas esmeraldas TaxID=1808958 RepID=A0AAW0F2I8_9TRYP